MCGISGLASREMIGDADIGRVRAMNDALSHRGPDGAGEFACPHVLMAMRRLSIIDLEGGWQPLYNEDQSLALIANGEIYNFVELRRRLETKGHRFKTGSDCEIILHLYEEHGLDCVTHLRGMFAFALWDSRLKRLLLARDRIGEKPLYLYERDGQLLFASEMKALLRSGLIPFELDAQAVDLYFHYQYVPEPLTAIKGVRKLDAAHLLTVEVEPWRIEDRCYWRMEDAPPLEGDPAVLIREQLDTISEIVIRSDVPVGVALSGGLDSSAIAALAAAKYPGTMHAFSVGYPGRPESDERADARRLAEHLGMPFHDVELDTRSMVEIFPELVFWRDDPIADISGYGYYAVSKLAREHGVPVLLQGQGGDELFWGYPWLAEAVRETTRKYTLRDHNALAALPHYLRMTLPRSESRYDLVQWALTLGGLRSGWESFRRDRAAENAGRFIFYDLVSDFRIAKEWTPSLYSKVFCEQLNGSNASGLFTFTPPWANVDVVITRLICDTYLRENGVAQGDRLSMASSIELRLPLLDYRFVETVVGLRKASSDVKRPAKDWLKASLSGLLPNWVTMRPKRGFTPPVTEWLKALFVSYGESLSDGYLLHSGVFSQAAARMLATGSSPDITFAFKALVLEQWCRQTSPETPYA